LANVWKENILADLELGDWKFLLAKELLIALKRKFNGQKMRIKVDVSDYTIERILLMKYKDG